MTKILHGKVTSAKADKTITVSVSFRETHPIYKKKYSITRKYAAHDPNNEAGLGDTVTISEVRPISKNKHFILKSIDKKSAGTIAVVDDEEQEVV